MNKQKNEKKHIKIRKWVKILLMIIFIFLSLLIYSRYLGTKGIIVKEQAIIDSNIPNNFYGLKIVQISDIHYKVTTDKNELKQIINEINKLKPDIVLLTGDLFDNNIKYTNKDYKDLEKLLNNINFNIGKYAIKGEHDLNIEKWNEIIESSGFIDINNKYELIYSNGINPILLVGISSNYKNGDIKNKVSDIYKDLNTDYKFSILMLHEPDFIDNIDKTKFNLILSGHSHGGQIKLPFIGNVFKYKHAKLYYKDFYEINNTKIYISSGIGTSKYKFRLFNRPSINLFRLRNK